MSLQITQNTPKLIESLPEGQIHPLTELFSKMNLLDERVQTLMQMFRQQPTYSDDFDLVLDFPVETLVEDFDSINQGIDKIREKFPLASPRAVIKKLLRKPAGLS